MVQITNGVLTLRVTRKSFLSQYQPCGYKLVDSHEEAFESSVGNSSAAIVEPRLGEVFQAESDSVENSEPYSEPELEGLGEEFEEEQLDLSEIPLSEMDFYQLCSYADQLGLDRKGLRSKKELRQLIKSNQ